LEKSHVSKIKLVEDSRMKQAIVKSILICAVFMAAIFILRQVDKPTIYIINEFEGETMQGRCMIIEYTINGVVQLPVTLYNYEGGRYENFMAELEKEGRVIR
jgi:hypothetical protein